MRIGALGEIVSMGIMYVPPVSLWSITCSKNNR